MVMYLSVGIPYFPQYSDIIKNSIFNYQWVYLKSGCISLYIIYSFEMSNYVKEKQNEQLLWEN